MMRRLSQFLAVGMVLLLPQGFHAVAQEGYSLKIGAIFSVTGSASLLGEPERNTVQMVVDKVNDTVGIKGHRLEILIEDDQTDTAKAVSSAQKLIFQP